MLNFRVLNVQFRKSKAYGVDAEKAGRRVQDRKEGGHQAVRSVGDAVAEKVGDREGCAMRNSPAVPNEGASAVPRDGREQDRAERLESYATEPGREILHPAFAEARGERAAWDRDQHHSRAGDCGDAEERRYYRLVVLKSVFIS